jgi:alpha-mannosidase
MNGTFSGDNSTVVSALFSNGHRANGTVSADCGSISWNDGSTWAALPDVPPVRVHIAPHTHNDVGWGETYMQYYFGSGPYPAAVRNVTKILSQVIAGLLADKKRRFSYTEQAYFQLFFAGSTREAQADIRGLVASGQLNFLNGAWSMSDEAAPSYVDMLDNVAVGHRGIASEFGTSALPTTTWRAYRGRRVAPKILQRNLNYSPCFLLLPSNSSFLPTRDRPLRA